MWTKHAGATVAAFALAGLAAAHDGGGATTATFSEWSAPMNLGSVVNTAFTDGCPFIAPDGLSLYFASNRPGGLGGLDIYVSTRPAVDAPWGPPENVAAVNSAGNELCPTILPGDRHFVFVSDRPGGCGGQDLYTATRPPGSHPLAWDAPQNLGCVVNSAQNDFTPSLYPDRAARAVFLYFSSNRPGGFGGADIYASRLQPDGQFGPAASVPELNTPFNDQRPNLRLDGKEIFFDSDRPGTLGSTDLWSSRRDSTHEPWSVPESLGVTVNSPATEARPSLSLDGQTLYFMSSRLGSTPTATGAASLDLWVTTRRKIVLPD